MWWDTQTLSPPNQSPTSLMQKPLSTQCHNVSRPIRQMNPQFQNTKHRFRLVCESQPSHIESIMCQADPSPQNQSPPSFPNSFPYNVEGEAQFVFNTRSHDISGKPLVYLLSDLFPMESLEGAQPEEWPM